MSAPIVRRSENQELNNVSRMYHARFEQACRIFQAKRPTHNGEAHREAYEICEELLGHSDLPIILQIKVNCLMAHGDKNFVAHAREAKRLMDQVLHAHAPGPHVNKLADFVAATLKEAEKDSEDPRWSEPMVEGEDEGAIVQQGVAGLNLAAPAIAGPLIPSTPRGHRSSNSMPHLGILTPVTSQSAMSPGSIIRVRQIVGRGNEAGSIEAGRSRAHTLETPPGSRTGSEDIDTPKPGYGPGRRT